MNERIGRPGARAFGIVALIAVAAAGGYFLQHSREPASPLQPVADVPAAASSAAQPEAPAPTAPPAARTLPDTLPQFELKDRDGKLRTLGDWKGKALIVNYWATWCPPCVREIPLLSKLRKDHQGEVEVIGIAVDFREDVLAFAAKKNLDYPC